MHIPNNLEAAKRSSVAILLVSAMALAGVGCNGSRDQLRNPGTTNTTQGDEVFPDTAIGRQLKEHLTIIVAVDEDSEQRYQQSLARLRNNPGVVKAIFAAYTASPEELYFQRQLLVETLKEMRSEEALDYLHRIASEPIPQEKFTTKGAEYSTREEEIIVRVTAIEGINYLASEGNAADKLLSGYVTHEDLTVRQLAVRGYLSAAGEETRAKRIARLKTVLPPEEHWFITGETTDIKSVPHPDMPEKFDLGSFKNKSSPPPRAKE